MHPLSQHELSQVEAITEHITGAMTSGDAQHAEELRGKLIMAEADYEAGKKRNRSECMMCCLVSSGSGV